MRTWQKSGFGFWGRLGIHFYDNYKNGKCHKLRPHPCFIRRLQMSLSKHRSRFHFYDPQGWEKFQEPLPSIIHKNNTKSTSRTFLCSEVRTSNIGRRVPTNHRDASQQFSNILIDLSRKQDTKFSGCFDSTKESLTHRPTLLDVSSSALLRSFMN